MKLKDTENVQNPRIITLMIIYFLFNT